MWRSGSGGDRYVGCSVLEGDMGGVVGISIDSVY